MAADATSTLESANTAIKENPKKSEAYFRKGVACFDLDEFESAQAAFQAGLKLAEGEGASIEKFHTWLRKCTAELDEEFHLSPAATNPPDQSAPATVPVALPSASSVPKIRHDWYQTASDVVITILYKGLKPGDVSVEFGETTLDVSFPTTAGSEYSLDMKLFDKVVVAQSSFRVSSVKVEIKLRKASPFPWTVLEGTEAQLVCPPPPAASSHSPQVASTPAAAALLPAAASATVPTPYASRKNWNAIDRDIKKEEEGEKPEGEEALNKLFRDIYGRADEGTRRAMNKSFQTSGGTVLSTNWSEVSTKDYDKTVQPPDGMAWKKWDKE